ncbi:hypothetical protein PQR75_34345 [Paraburkholderia fungorum]|uniref:hypothetical protein n=1 Tax=Paraburkholderia fungorum TaxID=134537 RepID=UPI0038BBF68F
MATRNKHGAWQEMEAFGANRWLSDPFAMVGEIATRRYTVAPDIQSLFQWQ